MDCDFMPPKKPFFLKASQPRPMRTWVRVPPPFFFSETVCPLVSEIAIVKLVPLEDSVGGSAEADAVVGDDAWQPGGISLPDGAELPLRSVAVELTEHHCCLRGGVLAQVVARELLVAGPVEDADVGVGHLTEALAPGVCLVDRRCEHDLGG